MILRTTPLEGTKLRPTILKGRTLRALPPDRGLLLGVLVAALLLAPACSMRVDDDKEKKGKKVDIETPMGSLHVRNESNVKDIGLPVYAGARLKEKHDGKDASANVSISRSLFGLKVIAAEYESDDPPEKVLDFYRGELKKYGPVLECKGTRGVEMGRGKHDDKDSDELDCDKHSHGDGVELKVGTKERQRIVAVKPRGKGSDFGLVLVETRKREGTL
jgi:hypothetical protein